MHVVRNVTACLQTVTFLLSMLLEGKKRKSLCLKFWRQKSSGSFSPSRLVACADLYFVKGEDILCFQGLPVDPQVRFPFSSAFKKLGCYSLGFMKERGSDVTVFERLELMTWTCWQAVGGTLFRCDLQLKWVIAKNMYAHFSLLFCQEVVPELMYWWVLFLFFSPSVRNVGAYSCGKKKHTLDVGRVGSMIVDLFSELI